MRLQTLALGLTAPSMGASCGTLVSWATAGTHTSRRANVGSALQQSMSAHACQQSPSKRRSPILNDFAQAPLLAGGPWQADGGRRWRDCPSMLGSHCMPARLGICSLGSPSWAYTGECSEGCVFRFHGECQELTPDLFRLLLMQPEHSVTCLGADVYASEPSHTAQMLTVLNWLTA
jgi:hypothetical protein